MILVYRMPAFAGMTVVPLSPAIAAGSVLTSWLPGHTALEAGLISASELIEKLGGLPLGKESCAALAISALGTALQGFSRP